MPIPNRGTFKNNVWTNNQNGTYFRWEFGNEEQGCCIYYLIYPLKDPSAKNSYIFVGDLGGCSDGSGDEPIKYYHKGILWTRWKEIQLHLNNESIIHD